MTSLSCFSVHFLAPLRVLSLDTVALASCLVTDAAAGVEGPNWPADHGPPVFAAADADAAEAVSIAHLGAGRPSLATGFRRAASDATISVKSFGERGVLGGVGLTGEGGARPRRPSAVPGDALDGAVGVALIASSSALSLNRTDNPLTGDDLTVGVDRPLGRLLVCVFSFAIFGAGFFRAPPPPNQPPDFFAGIAFSSLPLASAARSSSASARISCFSAAFSALAAARSSSNLFATA
mmetsp:Transcript_8952/g.36586  ORF Transcript_8952/g.36586 Transcript_8952/m.36586 type:complete len:237 (-) Transcript_8952:604-1314(-)